MKQWVQTLWVKTLSSLNHHHDRGIPRGQRKPASNRWEVSLDHRAKCLSTSQRICSLLHTFEESKKEHPFIGPLSTVDLIPWITVHPGLSTHAVIACSYINQHCSCLSPSFQCALWQGKWFAEAQINYICQPVWESSKNCRERGRNKKRGLAQFALCKLLLGGNHCFLSLGLRSHLFNNVSRLLPRTSVSSSHQKLLKVSGPPALAAGQCPGHRCDFFISAPLGFIRGMGRCPVDSSVPCNYFSIGSSQSSGWLKNRLHNQASLLTSSHYLITSLILRDELMGELWGLTRFCTWCLVHICMVVTVRKWPHASTVQWEKTEHAWMEARV